MGLCHLRSSQEPHVRSIWARSPKGEPRLVCLAWCELVFLLHCSVPAVPPPLPGKFLLGEAVRKTSQDWSPAPCVGTQRAWAPCGQSGGCNPQQTKAEFKAVPDGYLHWSMAAAHCTPQVSGAVLGGAAAPRAVPVPAGGQDSDTWHILTAVTFPHVCKPQEGECCVCAHRLLCPAVPSSA